MTGLLHMDSQQLGCVREVKSAEVPGWVREGLMKSHSSRKGNDGCWVQRVSFLQRCGLKRGSSSPVPRVCRQHEVSRLSGGNKNREHKKSAGNVESGGSNERSWEEELGGDKSKTPHVHVRNYQTVKKSLRKVKSLKHNLKKKKSKSNGHV